jgi:hypothetical protein
VFVCKVLQNSSLEQVTHKNKPGLERIKEAVSIQILLSSKYHPQSLAHFGIKYNFHTIINRCEILVC